MTFKKLVTFENWMAQGNFTCLCTHTIQSDYPKLGELIGLVDATDSFKVEIEATERINTQDKDGVWVCVFGKFEDITIKVDKFYLQIITDRKLNDYRYEYAPSLDMVKVFRENGLIGFVMRLQLPDEVTL